jgi:hypothetical protein
MQTFIDWTVDRIGNSDPVITVITLLVAVAAAHAGNAFTGFVMNKWSKRKRSI